MSEELFIEQLNEAIDVLIEHAARDERTASSDSRPDLAALVSLASELRLLPRENFKLNLKEALIRSAHMTTTGTETQQTEKPDSAYYQTITPYLTVKRPEQLIDFVKDVFGAVEVFRTTGSAGGLHAEVIIGDSKLMIGGMDTVEEIPTALHVYLSDADAAYQRGLDAGATSLEAPVDQFYGDREAGVKDPTGNVWWIATHKLGAAENYVPEGMRSVTPFLHPVGAPALIDFMKGAFGGEEISREQSPDGMVHHAVVRIGNSMIEMGEAHGELAQPMPPALFLNVDNLEESYQRALDAGATSIQVPVDQGYGRTAWVKDNWGNVWYLAAPVAKK
jgi:PhnB protein